MLAVLTAALAFRAPRSGVALALALPILPLGNIALALALLYTAVALVWFVLHAASGALLPLAGPLLGPLAVGRVLADEIGDPPLGAPSSRSPSRLRQGSPGLGIVDSRVSGRGGSVCSARRRMRSCTRCPRSRSPRWSCPGLPVRAAS